MKWMQVFSRRGADEDLVSSYRASARSWLLGRVTHLDVDVGDISHDVVLVVYHS